MTDPLQPILLVAPHPLDPAWFDQVRQGRHTGVTTERGVLLNGVVLAFAHAEQALPSGIAVEVWLVSWFYCLPLSVVEEQRKAAQALAVRQIAEERERRNQRRDAAAVVLATIHLPVAWDVAIKDVLSGLTATSMGDGQNRRTVVHIVLLDAFQRGRLTRSAWDLLCASSADRNGKRWSATLIRHHDGDGQEYRPAPTCRTCLRLAARNGAEQA